MSFHPHSEADALLGDDSPTHFGSIGIDIDPDADRPVRLRSFRRNVRRCKIALGCGLTAALATGIGHIMALPIPKSHADGDGYTARLNAARWGADAIILIFTAISAVLLGLTLVHRPFPARLRPADLGGLANMGIHRITCVAVFILMLLSIILHAAPDVIYTIVTKKSTPHQRSYTRHLSQMHVFTLVFSFFAVGSMRRGPKLRAGEAKLGTAFGVRAAPPREAETLWNRLPLDMDDDPKLGQVIDYGDCSMLTFVTLGYSLALAQRSLQVDQLTQTDLPKLEEWVRTSGNEYLSDLGPRGDEFQATTSMGLIWALWTGRGWAIFLTFALETLNTVISFVQITALHEIISSFGTTDDKAYPYLMCWGLFLGQAVEVLLSGYLWVRENYVLHNPVRMALSAMLYAKILRSTDAKAMEAQHLTSAEDEKANKGRSQVMNLLTIDVNTISSLATYLWNISNGLIRLFIGFVFLWQMLGPSAIVGILCVPLFAPISAWIAKKIYICDKSWARARDARIGAIKEFLMGIKVIKLNGFEDYERGRIGHLRDVETGWQRWRYTLGTLFNMVADVLPVFAVASTFVFFTTVMGRTLEPATAFVTIMVFRRVQSGLDMIPQAVDVVLSTKIALDRLKRYLNQDEVVVRKDDISQGMVAMDSATFTWPRPEAVNDPNESHVPIFRLRRVTLSLPEGRLSLVCGPLGSGKTLFLRALLGEAKLDSGHIIAPRSPPDITPLDPSIVKFNWTNELWLEDSVGYAPQSSYIRHGTVRDNILFGQPFWSERYYEVLRQCSLESDLALLVDGDMTEVGENGVNLSGGQKARINLARCVYSRARTLYLDDILSAVDAHTAQFIVDECFRGKLLRGRTVVLVSHHVDLVLPAANYVVALGDGRVQEACPARRAHVASLVALTSPAGRKSDLPDISPKHKHKRTASIEGVLDALVDLNAAAEPSSVDKPPVHEDFDKVAEEEWEDDLEPENAEQLRVLYHDEHQEVGHVRGSHYWVMIKAAGGLPYWVIMAVLFFGAQALGVSINWVMKVWTDDPDPSHLDYYVTLYIATSLLFSLVGSLRWVWMYGLDFLGVGFYSAGTKKIHRRFFDAITRAPLSFFESTPAGRILNVFAQDMRRLDSQSADDFGRTAMEFIQVATAAAMVGYEAPAMLLVLVAFGVPLVFVANGLGRLRTNLRRLAATADSPLISLYHDSIDGVVMLRAFGLANLSAQSMKTLLNRSRTAETWNWICYNWVRAVVLSLSSVFVTSTGFILVSRNISPAMAGFILTFAAQISGGMFGLLDHFIMCEMTFVSLERVSYFIDEVKPEPVGGQDPPADWPSEGAINFHNLSVRYAPDLPDVLHGINLSIAPGERVGVVGSTGSGKSTLALTLFRAVEPTSGSIDIDGIDITDVSLKALRSRLNMVVQDGSLPSGTLRNALDITASRPDAEIYDALRRVHLLPAEITSDEAKHNPFANLDTFVAAEGSNFSHGQRQLLCLARALLKRSKILVMDEATSSVDFEMDAKITQTIRECFAHTTMIVIAHRLATIVGYDKVIVLDKGRVKEFGKPSDLMRREGSAFRALCWAQGKAEFERLLVVAGG